jgi:hypothetical protein
MTQPINAIASEAADIPVKMYAVKLISIQKKKCFKIEVTLKE